MLARALSATGTERSRVLEIARAQARGDAQRRARAHPGVRAPSPPASPPTEAFVAKLKQPGEVEILQYRPSVQTPADRRGRHRPRRLARRRDGLPVVQCVRVRRDGPLSGAGVEVLSISAPIGREASCPAMNRNLPPEPVLRLPVMRPRLRFLLPVLALLAALPAAALAADKPNEQALYQDGPEGRYLLDGDWLFRLDNADQGIKQRFMRSTSTTGWTTVKVPNVWNLGDASQRVDERRDRLVPQGLRAARAPTPRSPGRCASSRSTTARRCGSTASRSARTPAPTSRSSSDLEPLQAPRDEPARGARRLAPARSRDFPPAGLNTDGVPTGGWWNYSGIQREVYLKKLDTVDFQKVLVRPVIDCGTCAASVQVQINLQATSPAAASG